MINILSWMVIGMVVLNVVSEPFCYGQPRKPYGTGTWISAIIGAMIIIPVALRALGKV